MEVKKLRGFFLPCVFLAWKGNHLLFGRHLGVEGSRLPCARFVICCVCTVNCKTDHSRGLILKEVRNDEADWSNVEKGKNPESGRDKTKIGHEVTKKDVSA